MNSSLSTAYWKQKWQKSKSPLALSLLLAMTIAALILFLGEDPIAVLKILLNGAFGSWSVIGYTCYYATSLILTGLSVRWAMQLGLFNIGAEGQMGMAGVAVVAFGLYFPELGQPWNWICCCLVAFVVGGLWASIASVLKIYRGAHEVLSTILLNFVSIAFVSYAILNPLKNEFSQAPESRTLAAAYKLPKWFADFDGSPMSFFFWFAVVLTILFAWISRRTIFGFHQRLTGGASWLAKSQGVHTQRQILMGFFISGGFAGLASLNEILGLSMKAKEGFTGGVGFMGIAVALLARGNIALIVLSGLFLGALHKGSLDLDLDTKFLSRDFSFVLQSLLIIALSANFQWHQIFAKLLSQFKKIREVQDD